MIKKFISYNNIKKYCKEQNINLVDCTINKTTSKVYPHCNYRVQYDVGTYIDLVTANGEWILYGWRIGGNPRFNKSKVSTEWNEYIMKGNNLKLLQNKI